MPLLKRKSEKEEMPSKESPKRALAVAYAMKHKKKAAGSGDEMAMMAQGGMAEEACPHCGHYSKGGEVANADEPMADLMPNEFDDLHLRDDLEFSDTGASSGDEDGPEGHEKEDLVGRILSKRKKQSNPRPA